MSKLFLSLFLATVLVSGPGTDPADETSPASSSGVQVEAVGTVAELQGKVTAYYSENPNEPRILALGDAVFPREIVSAAKDASVQIQFSDESLATLTSEASIRVDDFAYDETAKTGIFSAYIAKGIFRFITGKIAENNPKSVRLDVPSGTIGIRGTIVVGEIKGERCLVALEAEEGGTAPKHKIVVTNNDGKKIQQVEITKPGFATLIEKSGKTPKREFRLSGVDRDRFEKQLPPPRFLPRGQDGRPQMNPQVRDPRTTSFARGDDNFKPKGPLPPSGPGGGSGPTGNAQNQQGFGGGFQNRPAKIQEKPQGQLQPQRFIAPGQLNVGQRPGNFQQSSPQKPTPNPQARRPQNQGPKDPPKR